jgi:DNA-directed RNA polymerase specialized sigma24 family protein
MTHKLTTLFAATAILASVGTATAVLAEETAPESQLPRQGTGKEAPELLADDDAAAIDSRIDLQKLMAQLAPKTRRAIQMVKLDGLSVSEAALQSGMSESAIKVSVHRGLRALSLLVGKGAAHEE